MDRLTIINPQKDLHRNPDCGSNLDSMQFFSVYVKDAIRATLRNAFFCGMGQKYIARFMVEILMRGTVVYEVRRPQRDRLYWGWQLQQQMYICA